MPERVQGGVGSGAPEVSIVIPTRNRERIIVDAISRALEQVGVAVEVIVVDDASTDGTAQILQGLDDPRVRVVRRAERGRLAAARNSGIDVAEGEWVALLDDDDLWSPDKLRHQLDAARAVDAGFVYGGAITVDERLEPLHVWRLPQPDVLLRELLALNVIPAGASNVVARTELIRSLGGFDTQISHSTDWDMWIRLAAASRAACVPEILTAYRLHPQGQESDRGDEMVEELSVIEEKHRSLRLEMGVELDRVAFEAYVAKRQRRMAQRVAVSGPSDAPSRSLMAAARAGAGRVVRRLRGPARRAGVPRPDWLAAAAASSRTRAG